MNRKNLLEQRVKEKVFGPIGFGFSAQNLFLVRYMPNIKILIPIFFLVLSPTSAHCELKSIFQVIREFGAELDYLKYGIQVSEDPFQLVANDIKICEIGRGGEGIIYTADDLQDVCYKKSHFKQVQDRLSVLSPAFGVASILYMQNQAKLHPWLNEHLTFPSIYCMGSDWTLRDYYPNALSLHKAKDSSIEAKQSFDKIRDTIATKVSHGDRFLTRLEWSLIGASNNILWVPDLHKFVWIDIF